MIVGLLKEIKSNENRVALLPAGVELLVAHGHKVIVEKNAGTSSGFPDEFYKEAGAKIIPTAVEVYDAAGMIMKVKEPIKTEYKLIKKNQIVFTFFHFAASRELTDAMINSNAICIAYETVQKPDGSLPLLIPMSEVAGRMAPQEGAKYAEKPMGGRGILLGGVPGVEPADVVVLGGGVVGQNAARIASGLGARVTILDSNLQKLRYLDDVMPRNVFTLASNSYNIRKAVTRADVIIGAVLIPGAKAPKLITREMLKDMKEGSVIVDVSVDQGGCIETGHPTTHENPTYVVDGVLHYCVANMPGAVPFTLTVALTNSTLPYAVEIAGKGWENAVKSNNEIKLGLNMAFGKITYQHVAEAFGLEYTPAEEILD